MVKLFVPEAMKNAHPSEIKRVCNGCGQAGWKGKFVPNTVWGLSVKPACQIHDWMWEFGETAEDKVIGDNTFLNNMVRIVLDEGGLLRFPRLLRVKFYYAMVRDNGGSAYWDGKNKPEEMVDIDEPFFDFEDD